MGGDASAIWHCETTTDRVYELSTGDFSVVRFANPTALPYGIGGTATTIWLCDTGVDEVYELLTSDLSVFRSASSPTGNPSGTGGDDNTIWHCAGGAFDNVYELSTVDFSVVRSDNSPSDLPFGIGGDASTIWHCDYRGTPGTVYELSTVDLSVVRSASSPGNVACGMGGDDNTIWHCDDTIYHVYELDAAIPVVAPTVTTDPAAGIGAAAATLNGTLDDDGGEDCDCGFEWGETIAYGNTTPTQSRTTGQTFVQTITGLDPNKSYHFRAIATNAAGTGSGANRTFITLAAAPTVDTDPATDIEHIASVLNGELTYDGEEACNCGFQWGLTAAYGNTTPTQSRTTGQTFSQPISGLAVNTPYHFRAFATNSWGTSYGPDRSFTTLAAAPLATTDPASALSAIAATLNGTLDNDNGEACECGFQWGLDTGYGTITSTESRAIGETFSQVIGGLFPNTVYHFRAFARNSFGTGYGADRSFTSVQVISRSYSLARREL